MSPPASFNAPGFSFLLLDDPAVDFFLTALGKQGAPPMVREKVRLGGGFLVHHFKNPGTVVDYFKGIDLSRDVKVVPLDPGQVVTTRFAGGLGNWFSKSGVATQQVGLSSAGRQYKTFHVTRRTYALESRSAATVDTWTQGRTMQTNMPRAATPNIPQSLIGGVRSPGTAMQQRINASVGLGKRGPIATAGEFVSGGGIQYVVPEARGALQEIVRP